MLKTMKVTQKLHTTFERTQPIDFIEEFFHVSIEWE
jgi:hypothetical protein